MGQKEDRLVTGPGVAIVAILYAGVSGFVYIAWRLIRAICHDVYYLGLYVVYSFRYLIAKRKEKQKEPLVLMEHNGIEGFRSDEVE